MYTSLCPTVAWACVRAGSVASPCGAAYVALASASGLARYSRSARPASRSRVPLHAIPIAALLQLCERGSGPHGLSS